MKIPQFVARDGRSSISKNRLIFQCKMTFLGVKYLVDTNLER